MFMDFQLNKNKTQNSFVYLVYLLEECLNVLKHSSVYLPIISTLVAIDHCCVTLRLVFSTLSLVSGIVGRQKSSGRLNYCFHGKMPKCF